MPPDIPTLTNGDPDTSETREWLDSLAAVLQHGGPDRARYLLWQLEQEALRNGLEPLLSLNTPYVNTIAANKQPPLPGGRDVARRLTNLVRWNAMAMVVRANKKESGIGGHISTFASAATLILVGLNHFFRGPDAEGGSDQIYFQGHASPGLYAWAFLEGRLTVQQLENFRRELGEGGGLSSYPHPWLMPSFWQFPTVSMGLGPLMAIYQARFNRYLEHRGLKDTSQQRVWCFMGDGETDEPESLGALTLAARERLDNLTFIINCNLQRLDGPVRGNGKIIQELEAAFRGAGWHVIKVIWGSGWDELLTRDKSGLLVKLMGEVVDGEYQRLGTASGAELKERFFGRYPETKALVADIPDDQLRKMLVRGGHDPEKIYAAYRAAAEHRGSPTVILAKTIKGYGLGEAGEGRNITHQQKKLNEEELKQFRSRFGIPISDQDVANAPFYKPSDDSPELQHLRARRQELGGSLPARVVKCPPLKAPGIDFFQPFLKGSGEDEVSTTMAFVGMLRRLLQDKEVGKWIVPIIPDEGRTFGMEALFKQYGIYSSVGQLYEPVDSKTLLPYHETKTGQILEEGITEAGAISSFIAAGTAYATHGVPMIPFFIYYSMFGFQRVGDQIWAAADLRTRGFLLGATAGRTTLAGEGLQHQDGQSHILASTLPTLRAYDPAFAYEIAVIVQDGIRRMYQDGEDCFYYLTLGNENYAMPPMPDGAPEGIVRGMYKCRAAGDAKGTKVHLLGSGSILREALRAQEILRERFAVPADVWSVTSYKELHRNAMAAERWNLLHPTAEPRQSYLERALAGEQGVFVAASDYIRMLPAMISRWVPGGLTVLGTDGFGRSETRRALRRFFEVDAECIALAALNRLAQRGDIRRQRVQKAIDELGIDPEKADPVLA
jgi:pyruvate dehydrogenase E1 component